MRFHAAEGSRAVVLGAMVAAGVAWGRPAAQPEMWPETPPWAFDGAPDTGIPKGEMDTTQDIGDRSGGPASCKPVYTQDARQGDSRTGEPEKGDYGFTLRGAECPARG